MRFACRHIEQDVLIKPAKYRNLPIKSGLRDTGISLHYSRYDREITFWTAPLKTALLQQKISSGIITDFISFYENLIT
jgi:hypothetical protein